MATVDWLEWHADYDRPGSGIARRLVLVQAEIRTALDSMPAGEIRTLSMCAGEGRDLIGALDGHPRAADVTARLVELDPTLADRARASAAATGLTGIEVVTGDAGTTDAYLGATPADLVLVVGVLGNVTDADVIGVVRALPSLCAAGATVVLSRHGRDCGLISRLRSEMVVTGFREQVFINPDDNWMTVGRWTWPGSSGVLVPGVKLFDFVADVEQAWQRQQAQ